METHLKNPECMERFGAIEAQQRWTHEQQLAQWAKIEANQSCMLKKIDELRELIANQRVSFATHKGMVAGVAFVVSALVSLLAPWLKSKM